MVVSHRQRQCAPARLSEDVQVSFYPFLMLPEKTPKHDVGAFAEFAGRTSLFCACALNASLSLPPPVFSSLIVQKIAETET